MATVSGLVEKYQLIVYMKDINIVIVNYFSKDDISNAVASIFADLKNSNLTFQITVVDNSGNQDKIKEELATKFPAVKYIDSGANVGFSKGNNLGFNFCEARYYFAFNPDAYIPENSNVIKRMIKFMDENPKIGCVGPKILNDDGSLQHSCFRFNKSSILIKPFKHINWDKKHQKIKRYTEELEMKKFDHSETRPVDWVLGAAMMVRGEVAKKIGFFDERYFMYLEDCDWCIRMWEAGFPVYYLHDVIIKHKYKRDSSKTPGIFKALFRNRLARIHLSSWLKYVWKWRKIHKFYE